MIHYIFPLLISVICRRLLSHAAVHSQCLNSHHLYDYFYQGGYVIVVVCLLATLCKNFGSDLHEIFREGWQWASEQMITFWWRSGSLSGTGIVFWIRHYWEIQKVVSEHKSAADTDSPDGGTGKTCLGGGMHCPSASS